jgi:hypothetical protein
MNSQKPLYLIIALLVLMNVAFVFYMFGGGGFNRFNGFGMMGNFGGMHGGNTMMHGHEDADHEHTTEQFDSWGSMVAHMEEEHGIEGETHRKADYDKPVAETHKDTYDFGKIKKSAGIVSTTFEIENHGKQELMIGKITTSCGCTSAEVSAETLGFNEETTLTVHFDPNFHDEPQGKITRSVFVPTNDPDTPELQFDILVEILEE